MSKRKRRIECHCEIHFNESFGIEFNYDMEFQEFIFVVNVIGNFRCIEKTKNTQTTFGILDKFYRFRFVAESDVKKSADNVITALTNWDMGKYINYVNNRAMRVLGMRSDDLQIKKLCEQLEEHKVHECRINTKKEIKFSSHYLSTVLYRKIKEYGKKAREINM